MEEEAQEVLKAVKKSPKLRLQLREYEVLMELDKRGLLALGQLEGLFFRKGPWTQDRARLLFQDYERETYDRYGYKRLSKLERTGYIRRFYYWISLDGHRHWGYGLTRLGKDQVRRSKGIGFRRNWSNQVVLRYIRLNGVGLALTKILGLDVKSRHQLAYESRAMGLTEVQAQSRIPDLKIEGKRPFLVMIGPCSLAREERRWKEDINCPLVYLVSEAEQGWTLRRARDAGASQVYVGVLRQFEEKIGEAVLTRPDKTTVTLGELIGRSSQDG